MEVLSNKEGKKYFNKKLLLAIEQGENAQVELILQRAGDIWSLVDNSECTLLHYAVLYRNLIMAMYFINAGTKVDVQDRNGKTPLMLAVENEDYGMISLLLKRNANLYIMNKDDKNALQTALTTANTNIIETLLFELKNKCIKNNEDIASKLFNFNIPLHQVMLLKSGEVTKTLLEKYNYEVDIRSSIDGKSALHIAVQQWDVDNVKVLVEHNAHVDARDQECHTPLYIYGITSNYPDQKLEILKMLMDAGATCNLIQAYCGTFQCFPLLSEGTREAVRLFLRYNIDLHARDAFEQTPVHYLALNKHPGIFEELEGKDFDVNVIDDDGYTPLHKAVGNPSSVEYLLKNGANVDALTYEERHSALFKAFTTGRYHENYVESIELLLQRDAEVQTRDTEGWTVLDWALQKKKGPIRLTEPVLAHLAMAEDCGRRTIARHFRKRINSHRCMRKLFKACKRQLDQMKIHKLCGIVTFYQLLTANEEDFARYLRNQQLVLKLIRIGKKCQTKSYYVNTLRKRLTEAIQRKTSKERAAVVLSTIMGIYYRANHVIVDAIVCYLCDKDIQSLNQTFC